MPGKIYFWKLRTAELHLGVRTLIMGVLNVTPDSFSDGGRYNDPDRAYARALELEEAGADIIDIGAESTRPGSQRVSAEEEWRRLIPVLKRLKGQLRVPISLDTYKAETAERAFEYGVEIINDPSGLTFEPNLAKVVAQANAGFVLNHMRGAPENWGKLGPIPDVMGTVARELEATAHRAQRAGVDRSRIVIDPGLGFGKRKEQNSELVARLDELTKLEYPILVGPSRKSFIARGTEEETAFATAAAVTAAILEGAHVVRVHDVAAMHPAIRVADEVARAKETWRRENEGTVKVKRVTAVWTGETPKPVKPTLRITPPPPITQAAPEALKPAEVRPPASKPPSRESSPGSNRGGEGYERPPRRFDRPPAARQDRSRGDRPPRDDRRRDPRDSARRFDGPPRENRGDFRRDGPPRGDAPARENRGGFRREGPPGGPRRGGPRQDGPRGEGPRRDGPRRDGPRRDGPPRGSRPGGKPPWRPTGGKPPSNRG